MPQHLGLGVAGELAEGVRGVHDGGVGLGEVAEEEGDGAVDGAEIDFGVGAGDYSELWDGGGTWRK